MLNTTNLELTAFIDPELTWKTVKKGVRSVSRRPKKPVRTLDVSVQPNDKSSKNGELSVSESEKLGASVLGRRFAEKIEDVPIKKRRLLLQSPSTPPQTPSPYREESLSSQPWTSSPQPEDFDQTVEDKRASGQWCCSDSVSSRELGTFNGSVAMQFSQGPENAFVNRKLSELMKEKVGHAEDFSGIALLAAAACNSSINDDAQNVKEGPVVHDLLISEGTDSSTSATAFGRTATSSESGNFVPRESTDEDNIDGSMIQDDSAAVSRNCPVNRLHWDLNTVMEEWELPYDDLDTDSQRNGSEAIPDDVLQSENLEKPAGRVGFRDEHALEPFPESEPISIRPPSEGKTSTSPANVITERREASHGVSAMQIGQKISKENVPGKHEVFLTDPAVSNKVGCDSDSIQSEEVSRKTLHLPHNGTSQTELVSTVTCQMSDVEYSLSKSGKSGPSNSSSEHENSSELSTSFGEGQPVGAVDVAKKQDKEALTADAVLMDTSLHFEPKELMPKSYECFGKEDPIYGGYGSDASHGGHDHSVRVGKIMQIQAGYESPFEDGELRESDVYPCAENEVEGDIDCVDYDSDCRDEDEFNAANQYMSEVGSDSCPKDNNGSLQEKNLLYGKVNSLKESSHSTSLNKFTGQNQLPEGCECSTKGTSEANNISTQKKFASEFIHGLDVEGSSAGEVGSRETRGILLSHVEESSCSDALCGKDSVYMQRSRSSHDSGFQGGRMFGSEKYFERDRPALPMRGRSRRDHTVNSQAGYWNSRNHYQNGYPQGTGHPRPRSVTANSEGRIDGLAYREQRRYTNHASKGVYRPLMRRGSPEDIDDSYSPPRRTIGARDNSNYMRSRGRSGMYRQGFNRVPKEKYDGPMSDNPASSSARLPHYLSRRERSFSPIIGRDASFSGPRRKSQSRSRTRSPVSCHLQREGNMGMRHLSRSPDFRSDARMGRARMRYQKSNYAVDDERVSISPPRTRFSPQRHSRWIDDQNCASPNFRERKLPGRLFGWSQKYDSVGSHGRIKSDDCFRPMIRPGRFTEVSVGDGREHKYDGGNWERAKYRDRYENIEKNRSVRRCNTSGETRRIRHDEEDCFEVHASRDEDGCIKGIDRRDTPRSAREERGPLRYSNERVYASGPKLTRIRDFDEDASPNRG